MSDNTIGIIGLGNMGSALAQRLSATYSVVGFDLSPERRDAVTAHGVRAASALSEIAAECRVILLSLPNPAASARVVAELIGAGLPEGTTIVETSTVLPEDSRRAAERCAESSIAYVDAAILSGTQPVIEGKTTLLLSGDATALAGVAPVLDAITTSQRSFGPAGSAMAAKVINNLVAHDVYVVLAEAFALAEANGVEVDSLVSLLADPGAGLVRPLTHRIAERWKERDFIGGMSIAAAKKDSRLALAMAQVDGIPLFATQASHTAYELASAKGWDEYDYAVLAMLWDESYDGPKAD